MISKLLNSFCYFLFLIITPLLSQAQSNAENLLKSEALANQGYVNSDVQILEITDQYTSKNISHTYFRQAVNGIEIFNTHASVHTSNFGHKYIKLDFIKGLDKLRVHKKLNLSATEIIKLIAAHKKYDLSGEISITSNSTGLNQEKTIKAEKIALNNIPARLVYYLHEKELHLAWEIAIESIDATEYVNYIVNASTGVILEEISWIVSCNHGNSEGSKKSKNRHMGHTHSYALAPNTYNVYPIPVESPNFGVREIVTSPWLDNPAASPNGWHSIAEENYTTTHGNNVDAYDDSDSDNQSGGDANRADGGVDLEFDFPLDTSDDPALYKDAAISNVFYWSNITHDILYNYGFDEPSGNFQAINNTNEGLGDDWVRAEVQDGSGTCNANFGTPPDGLLPRMQMYLCNGRDGDYDNGVIIHEIGHGVSNRLTGGPNNTSCLGNSEQMGEGWSDYLGIIMTIEPEDVGTDLRPMGTWLFGEGPNGNGIRPFPYTTDMSINPMTYATIGSGVSVPHGVGSVWCTMLWDLTWALIDLYGYDADIYNGTGGNNIALQLVMDGMKMQACQPGFVDGRDAIIAADAMNNGGANECLIWEVFANRGLGFSANQGSSGSVTDGTEAFDLPPSCTIGLEKVADKTEAETGENIVYTITSSNNTADVLTNVVVSDDLPLNTIFVNADSGGTESMGTVTWPAMDLAVGASKSVQLTVQIDPTLDASVQDIIDNMESGTANWSPNNSGGSTSWDLGEYDNSSPSNSWFAPDNGSPGVANLEVAGSLGITESTTLIFSHFYDTEATWDGGVIEISVDDGSSWTDLEPNITANGYNSTIYNSRPGWSGDSGGFITTEVDLSAYDGQTAKLRFQMNCDQAVGGNGWYIDDVVITNLALYVPNIAYATDGNLFSQGIVEAPTKILVDPNALKASVTTSSTSCFDSSDGLASVVAQDGSGSYTYLWSNNETTSTISGLSAGTYNVTIDDGISTIVKAAVVDGASELTLQLNSTETIASSGTATVDVSNGTPGYEYLWDNANETTSTITGLSPGTYTVVVTDMNNCTKTESVEVINPIDCEISAVKLTIAFDQYPEEISYELVDDMGAIISSGGPYDNQPDGSTLVEYFCLVDGCYDLVITDSYGDGLCGNNSNPEGFVELLDLTTGVIIFSSCDFSNSVTNNFCFPALTIEFDKTNPSCAGESDGEATANPVGGSGNYTYSWSNGATTQTITGLAAGTYEVTVTDGVFEASASVLIDVSQSIVTTVDDNIPGSLRDIILTACPSDTVRFDVSLLDQTIFVESEILIQTNVAIKGLGKNQLNITTNNLDRIFRIRDSSSLYIEGATLMDTEKSVQGGAILNQGTLTLQNINFVNNKENGIVIHLTNEGTLIIQEAVEMKE